jgi:hypothetical protein
MVVPFVRVVVRTAKNLIIVREITMTIVITIGMPRQVLVLAHHGITFSLCVDELISSNKQSEQFFSHLVVLGGSTMNYL